eukprot:11757293-Prorocentrum_lima.AAC.1
MLTARAPVEVGAKDSKSKSHVETSKMPSTLNQCDNLEWRQRGQVATHTNHQVWDMVAAKG